MTLLPSHITLFQVHGLTWFWFQSGSWLPNAFSLTFISYNTSPEKQSSIAIRINTSHGKAMAIRIEKNFIEQPYSHRFALTVSIIKSIGPTKHKERKY